MVSDPAVTTPELNVRVSLTVAFALSVTPAELFTIRLL